MWITTSDSFTPYHKAKLATDFKAHIPSLHSSFNKSFYNNKRDIRIDSSRHLFWESSKLHHGLIKWVQWLISTLALTLQGHNLTYWWRTVGKFTQFICYLFCGRLWLSSLKLVVWVLRSLNDTERYSCSQSRALILINQWWALSRVILLLTRGIVC